MAEFQTKVVVQTQVEGLHYWENCNIEEVSFLKYPHRHIFYIRLEKEVVHDDRDIEIIKLKRDILEYINYKWFDIEKNIVNFNGLSCEMIAKKLLIKFKADKVEVLEDNENGAIVC